MHVTAAMRMMPRPGRPCYGIFGVAALVVCFFHISGASKTPVVGDVYSNAEMAAHLPQPTASGTGALSIQSATAATSGPTCNGDSQCQALCPTADFTKAQPALTAAAVQQQVWGIPPHVLIDNKGPLRGAARFLCNEET